MAIKVFQAELLRRMEIVRAAFNSGPYKIGLFRNDWTPANGDVLAAVTPCIFGGYDGLRDLTDWESPTWSSPYATLVHPSVVWTADGSSGDLVYGYYVVDGAGLLAWAERRTGGPRMIGSTGQTYSVVPSYRRKSEF